MCVDNVGAVCSKNAKVVTDGFEVGGTIGASTAVNDTRWGGDGGDAIGKATAVRQDDGDGKAAAIQGAKLVTKQRSGAADIGVGQNVHEVNGHRSVFLREGSFFEKSFPITIPFKKLWIVRVDFHLY